MIPDLNGKWTGELIYDESFGKLANEKLFFLIEINRLGDEFKGICFDIDGIGIYPSEAKVNGFLDDAQINFVKEYKSIVKTDMDSPIMNPANKRSAEISFSGTYNSFAGEFEGEWISLTDFVVFNNNSPGSFKGGTWKMRKEI